MCEKSPVIMKMRNSTLCATASLNELGEGVLQFDLNAV